MADALGIESLSQVGAVANGTTQTVFTARDLLTAIFYHGRAALIAFAVPVALGLLGAVFSSTNYTADAKLLVLLGPEYVYTPQVGQAGSGIAFDRSQIVQSELDILQSNELSAATVQAIGVNRLYPGISPDRPDAVRLAAARFASDLTVTSATESTVVDVSFRNHDRDLAAETVNKLLSLYIARRGEVFGSDSQETDDERQAYAGKLADAEAKLASFSAAHGITDLDQQITLISGQRSSLAAQTANTLAQIAQTRAEVDSLQRQLAQMPANVPDYQEATRSTTSNAAAEDLARLQSQAHLLAARYQPDFPALVEVNREVAELQGKIGTTPELAPELSRTSRSTTYDDIASRLAVARAALQGLEASAQALSQQSATLEASAEQLTNDGAEYRTLKRNRDVLDETYRTFAQNSEVAQLNAALARARASDVRILQNATPPATGSNPARGLVLAGLLVGFVAAIATIALLSVMRQVLISTYDTEMALGVPVLLAAPLRSQS